MNDSTLTLSVIIPTYNRAACIRRNLRALAEQSPPPAQVIIVDASPNDLTEGEIAVAQAPFEVVYRRNAAGRGNTPSSRNMALLEARGEIIAFLDDDAFPRPGWARALIESYGDPTVSGVAGRAFNGVLGEELVRTEDIGRLHTDGTLSGNFTSDPGKIVEVDHMIGCNMSFRREVMARLGGFRDDFRAGPFGICEETEFCIRARRLGCRLVYNAAACADHIGAPQPGGRRFSPTYDYYLVKNHVVMMIRNYGLAARTFRSLLTQLANMGKALARRLAAAVVRCVCTASGLVLGVLVGLRYLRKTGSVPERNDPRGQEIRAALQSADGNAVKRNTAPLA